MFFIDGNTLDYLRLTGREEAQIKLVETYAKQTGLWADALKTAQYERVLRFDLSLVVRNMAGPSNPHSRLPTSALAERGIAGKWEDCGQDPTGGNHCRHHAFTNTISRAVIAAVARAQCDARANWQTGVRLHCTGSKRSVI